MIQKIQNLFHIDKWWGRALFLISFYLLFFIVGYLVWFLFPNNKYNNGSYIMEVISPIYFFFFLPVLSFFLVFKIKKTFNLTISKIVLFIINFILISLFLFLFLFLLISGIRPNFF
jgi:hypothetical protein